MHHARDIQNWLHGTNLCGIILPSTDEFLSEFPPPAKRRLRWATGFRGSTGTAVIMRDAAALFLDGRYIQQGIEEVADTGIAVRGADAESRRSWLIDTVPHRGRLGILPALHSALDVDQWRVLTRRSGFELELVLENPVDVLWTDGRPSEYRPSIRDYPLSHAGAPFEEKRATLLGHMRLSGLDLFLVADPEDVSWLLNVRVGDAALQFEVGDWHIVPSCPSRVLVHRQGTATWFVDPERVASAASSLAHEGLSIAHPDLFIPALRRVAPDTAVGADVRRTPALVTETVSSAGAKVIPDDFVARCRWRKHPNEILAARRIHVVDAAATVRWLAWLMSHPDRGRLSEFEAAQALEAFRREHPDYKGQSMPLMSASGPNGAKPHYIPRSEGSRLIADHPIFWMDSGGQYAGGTTDNTVTVAIKAPEAKHILAHTLILKGYIALASAKFPVGTAAFRLDTLARQALWSHGMDYVHNTGHGVGNFLNIHEGPLIGREPGPTSSVLLEPGMIITNEPGYYLPHDFGMRIESHMLVVPSSFPGFLEFETISRLPIDPRLVDFERLSSVEIEWLTTYHLALIRDLDPMLDASTARWLREYLAPFQLSG